MGLFDKLKGTVLDTANKAVDAVNKAVDTVKESIPVLNEDDDTSKRYYEVCSDLLFNIDHLTKDNIKKFFNTKLNEKCDDTVLEKALSKFEAAADRKTGETTYTLSYTQRENLKSTPRLFEKEEIINICFNDFIEKTRLSFKEILYVIKDNPTEKTFEQGRNKIINSIPHEHRTKHDLIAQIFGEEMVKYALMGDPTVKAVLVNTVIIRLAKTRLGKYSSFKTDFISNVHALVLRGLHFKRYVNLNDYPSFIKEDCRSAVLNFKYYQDKINTHLHQNPFDDKEKLISGYISEIYTARFLHYDNRGSLANKDTRFVDAVCYYTMKSIIKDFDNNYTVGEEKLTDIICNYIDSMLG